ncbi:MAG TPA: glycosyltransferase [Thermoanaerobaculia bacterium]|nr:glycosyltransferase [Thermoanaerobaculia bacterium]
MSKLVVAPFAPLRRYISREIWLTLSTLVWNHDWYWYETHALPPGRELLPDVLRDFFGIVPEVVLFWESYMDVARHTRWLHDVGTRVYVMTDDLHKERQGMREGLLTADGVLSTYPLPFAERFPQVDRARVTWIPHSASSDFVLPLAPNPRYRQVFVSGATNELYPLRMLMRGLGMRRPELVRVQDHPGYRIDYAYPEDVRVGRGYAQSIRSCLAGFTDASRNRYIVAKHFEIPATGALLLADRTVAPELAELGFIDGEHYVSVTADDYEPIVERVLDPGNADEIDAIRARGHQLVYERHTTAHRAMQIDAVCV